MDRIGFVVAVGMLCLALVPGVDGRPASEPTGDQVSSLSLDENGLVPIALQDKGKKKKASVSPA